MSGEVFVQPRVARFEDGLELESGVQLRHFDLEYTTQGQLNADGANAILICPGLSGDAQVAGRRGADDLKSGWWDIAVGSGKMIDTDRYFVICTSLLGGMGGSTAPASIDPSTGRPFGMRFPVITIGDMVRAQRRLIDRLGVRRLHAVVGGCLGGSQALEWGVRHGDRVARVIAMTVRAATPAYSIALWSVIRRAIRSDPHWRSGDYYDFEGPRSGLGLATVIAMLQWIDPGVLDAKYGRDRLLGMPTQYGFEPEFAVEHMIDHVGEGADSRLDANSFLYLTKAIDYFDLAAGHETLRAALVPAGGDYLLVSYERDHRYPPAETERLAAALRDCGRCVKHAILSSPFSHGAYQFDLEGLTPLVKEHLASPTVRSVRDARLTEPVEHDFAHSEAMSPSLEKS